MKRGISLLLAACVGVLAGCAGPPQPEAEPPGSRPTPAVTPAPSALPPARLAPSGNPLTVVDGLDAPWSMVRLGSGSTLISERDTAMVRELGADGSLRDVGQVPGVSPSGRAACWAWRCW